MAYEQKPGDFAIFKNDRKEKPTHPDYTGNGLDLEGNRVQISCWLKEGKKGKFFSCQMKPPYEGKGKPAEARQEDGPSDDFPF